MSWFSKFIRSSVAKALWNLSVQMFILKLGKGGKDILDAAKKAVTEAELSGKSGDEKKKVVVAVLRHEFKELKQGFIDSAIQLMWMWVDEFLKENDGNLNALKESLLKK